MVRLNLIYDLLQTTKISSGTVGVKREKDTDQIYFVIGAQLTLELMYSWLWFT